MSTGRQIAIEHSPKRVRVMVNGKTVADSLCTVLLMESGHTPVYYFPREDVRMDLCQESHLRTQCPVKGEAFYWSLNVGTRFVENAAWSYREPKPDAERVRDFIAFEWDKVDHWFEEDEEVFGHARDPHHRIDVRRSSREVRVTFAGETIATSRRAMFLFETGLPTRCYVPPLDVRSEFLNPSPSTTICPYKGEASYWSIEVGNRTAPDAAWAYLDPLPEFRHIQGHICFYPEKVDLLEIEGETNKPSRPRVVQHRGAQITTAPPTRH